jgi:tetratricopeptide (TPR) repeat protein
VFTKQAAASLLALSEEAAQELVGLDARRWQTRLEPRTPELKPALDWFLENGRGEEALRLAVSLPYFWVATGQLAEGQAMLERALGGSIEASASRRALGYFHAGMLAFWRGEDAAARDLFEQGVQVARSGDDPTGIALGLTGLARLALREKDSEKVRELCGQALNTCASNSETLARSNALHVLAVAAQMEGDLEQARELMGERLELAREMGNYLALAAEASNLSMVERQLGKLARAEELARQSTIISEKRGDEWGVPYDLNSFAAIAVERGQFARAAKLLGAAEAILDDQDAEWPPDELEQFELTRARLIAELDPAALQRCWQDGRSWPRETAISYALKRADQPRPGDAPDA